MATRHATIVETLGALHPKLRRNLGWLAAGEVALAALAWVLASFAVDRLTELPWFARLVLLAALGAGTAFLTLRGLRRLARSVPIEDFAAAVEGSNEDLEGHLLNVLDLPSEMRALEGGSDPAGAALERRLLERALAESSERASRSRFDRAISGAPIWKRWSAAAACGVAGYLLFTAVGPESTGVWIRRNLLLSSELWPRKTHFVLDRLETTWHCARKEPLEVAGWATGEIPRQVTLVLDAPSENREVTLIPGVLGTVVRRETAADDSAEPLEGRRLLHVIPSVVEPLELRFEGGDNVSETVRVVVHDRPRILVTRLTLQFPAYLGLEARTIENPAGDVSVPAGTSIVVAAEADMDVAKGWTRYGSGEKTPVEAAGKTIAASFQPAETGFLDLAVTDAAWGLESDPPLRFAFVVVPDRAPTVKLEIAGEGRSATPRGKVGYAVIAEDDHGFNDLALKVTARKAGDFAPDEELPSTSIPLERSPSPVEGGVRARVEAELDLAPLQLTPGAAVSLQALVVDNDGVTGPKSAQSQVETIAIVDPDALRKEMDKARIEAQTRLENLAREEEEVAKELTELAMAEPEEARAGDAPRSSGAASKSARTSARNAGSGKSAASSAESAEGAQSGAAEPSSSGAPSGSPKAQKGSRAASGKREPKAAQKDSSAGEPAAKDGDAPAAEPPAEPDAGEPAAAEEQQPPGEAGKDAQPSPKAETSSTKAGKTGKSAKTSRASKAASKSGTSGSEASPSEASDAASPSGAAEQGSEASPSPSGKAQSAPAKASSRPRAAGKSSQRAGKTGPAGDPKPAGADEKPPEEAETPSGGEEKPAEEKEASPFDRLAEEQKRIGKDAATVAEKVKDMANALRRNDLLDKGEDRRLESEVTKPLDEISEEKLPESASEIDAAEGADRPRQAVQDAQRKSEKIADGIKKVADKLAGAGDFREILQRLEVIIEIQKKAIDETERRVPQEKPHEGTVPKSPEKKKPEGTEPETRSL